MLGGYGGALRDFSSRHYTNDISVTLKIAFVRFYHIHAFRLTYDDYPLLCFRQYPFSVNYTQDVSRKSYKKNEVYPCNKYKRTRIRPFPIKECPREHKKHGYTDAFKYRKTIIYKFLRRVRLVEVMGIHHKHEQHRYP